MNVREFSGASVHQCEGCASVFLPRSSLTDLVDGELKWHAHRASHTAPLPRITADMTAPPPSAPRAQSFLDSLFGR